MALLERGGQRALPLTGKSQRPEAAAAADPRSRWLHPGP